MDLFGKNKFFSLGLVLIVALLMCVSCGGSGGGGGDDDDDDSGTATVTSCDGSTLTDFSIGGINITIVNNTNPAEDRDNLPDLEQVSSSTIRVDCSGGCDSDSMSSVYLQCATNSNTATLWCDSGNIAGFINLDPLEGTQATCITGTVECSGTQVTGGLTVYCENP